ncbi:ferritin-like-domain-containing protein [Rhodocollybia butyracea]|uniref:Ferritin-like-domain-containing protein n=1 Tax=Rhodocollybia butyracea TaxID=206335 RepID=A0A9P5U8T8_9AGAR|nr:ferritin-like-domain-containing protein [Rhodocollybia butyracea]
MSPQQSLKRPIYRAPTGLPDWEGEDGLEKLHEHLQTAVLIELHTIPLYLFAAYSIKDSPLSIYKIISVVKQEMLHLGLSGNVLRAVGGTPRLYGETYTPIYPVGIFYEERVKMELKPATRSNVATFADLEAPLEVPKFGVFRGILPEYHSIGEFYQALLAGLKIISDKYDAEGRVLFQPDSEGQQFHTADGSWYDDAMIRITDLKSAVDALTLVIEQGEGSTGVSVKDTIQTHYEVFSELRDDEEKHPLDCYPVVENPETYKFENSDPKIHKVMLFSDAVYSYLLMTLEKLWRYDGIQRGRLVTNNVMNLMLAILKPVALFLVTLPLESDPTKHAAAPYNRHDFRTGTSTFAQLKELMNAAIAQYPGATEGPLRGVQQAVDNLIDIDTL